MKTNFNLDKRMGTTLILLSPFKRNIQIANHFI